LDQTPVPVVSPPELPAPQTFVCANCGAPLSGDYCAACGQKHEPHIHALGHFAGEALESVTHADSRLWRTLGYLLVKPGRLTREFFDGRRASYLPPFRLYLVISLAFFLVAGMPGVENRSSSAKSTGYERVDELNQTADDLAKDLGDNPGGNAAIQQLRAEAAQEKARLDRLKASGADAATMEAESRDKVTVGGCDNLIANRPPNAGLGYEMALGFCQKIAHASAKQFVTALVHNIPRAMFVFLPLMALFMKLLYWRPKRYYVEHLLFLVHNHAFAFLAFIIIAVLVRLNGNLLGALQGFLWLYMFWYIFRAMRVYYGQSRALTFGKYTLIGLLYVVTAVMVLTLTAAYSALTLGD
jgi:hypothetical protein